MTVKICAVGDIMLDQQPLTDTFGVKEVIRRRGTDFLFEEVQSIFRDSDLVFGNLECSIRKDGMQPTSGPGFFCADPRAIKCLSGAGINVLSVANNHIMENGMSIYHGTIEILRENQMTPVGVVDTTNIIERNGKRIGFLAYSFIDDGIPLSGYNRISTADEIIQDIEEIRPNSDVIIVSVHWGQEYVPVPSPEQIQIGRILIDAGADIVLGGHPHVTQGYEHYNNGLIIYSLGNFIFDHTYIPSTRESFIAEITVHDSPRSIDVAFTPILINEHDYQPKVASEAECHAILDAVEATRRSIEGKSLTEYREMVGDYDTLSQDCMAGARAHMKSQFVRNVYRYSFSTSCGILRQYLWKKPRRAG